MGLTRSPIGLILISQLTVTCLASLVLLGSGNRAAASVLLGGMICILPNAFLAYRLTARRTADPRKLANTLYTAEIGKIFITGILFALVFATQKWILPLALLGGFGLAQLTHWLTPVISDMRKRNK